MKEIGMMIKRTGKGKYQRANGTEYDGVWKDAKIHGKGKWSKAWKGEIL